MKLRSLIAGSFIAAALLNSAAAFAQTVVPRPAPISPSISTSAASSSKVLKASAGSLITVYVNPTAAGWLYVINATSAPSDGAITAGTGSGNYEDCIPAPAGVGTSISYDSAPESFSTGITAEFSSTACGTLTASANALIHGQVR